MVVVVAAPIDVIVSTQGERVGRGGGEGEEGPIPMENVLLSPSPTKTEESVPELGGHDIVEDGIEGRVGICHDPGKVENRVVSIRVRLQNASDIRDLEGKFPIQALRNKLSV